MFEVIFINVCYIGFVIYLEYQHQKERKQLYSRIQSRDLTEYKRIEEPKKEEEKKKEVRFV